MDEPNKHILALERKAAEARKELVEAKRTLSQDKHTKILGNAFRFLNRYPTIGEWWLYCRVIGAKDGLVRLLTFQIDHKGMVQIDRVWRSAIDGDYEPIELTEFNEEWEKLLKKLSKMNSQKLEPEPEGDDDANHE